MALAATATGYDDGSVRPLELDGRGGRGAQVLTVGSPSFRASLLVRNTSAGPLTIEASAENAERWEVSPHRMELSAHAEVTLMFALVGESVEAATLLGDTFLLLSAPLTSDEPLREGEEHVAAVLLTLRLLLAPPMMAPPLDADEHASPVSLPCFTPRSELPSHPGSPDRVTKSSPPAQIDARAGTSTRGSGDLIRAPYTPYDDRPSDCVSEASSHSPTTLVRRLTCLLLAPLDEFEPWFKWKVFDILWAVGLLMLAKRIRCVARLQEALDL